MIVNQTNIVTTKACGLLRQSENTFTSLVSYKYCVNLRSYNTITHFFNKTSGKTLYYKVLIDALKSSTFNIKWLILFKLTFLYILKTSNFQFCPHVSIYIMKCSHYKIQVWPMQFYFSFNHIYLILITINTEVTILAPTCNVSATNENWIQHCNTLLKSDFFFF